MDTATHQPCNLYTNQPNPPPPHTPQQQLRQGIFAGTHYLNWTLTLIIQPLISNPCWPTFSIRLEKNTKISSSDNLLPVAKLSDSEKRPSPLRFPNFSLLVGQNAKMIVSFPEKIGSHFPENGTIPLRLVYVSRLTCLWTGETTNAINVQHFVFVLVCYCICFCFCLQTPLPPACRALTQSTFSLWNSSRAIFQ